MPWIRGLIFTLLVPCVVGGYVPHLFYRAGSARSGLWEGAWLLVALGAIVYARCLLDFLVAGGTPAIYFTRPLKFMLGDEPRIVVRSGLYKFSRNPMYLGVLLAVFGQAILFASLDTAIYGAALWLGFHLVVMFLEEPHLRKARGQPYEEYCRRVPRWFVAFPR